MRIFVGQTRGNGRTMKLLRGLDIGEIVQPFDSLPPRRLPWALDNGAYSAWRSGLPFDAEAWLSFLTSAAAAACAPPAFAVCPDIVAGGLGSLAFSRSWLPRCASALRAPWYLAVQDGMTADVVRAAIVDGFGGIFVGGSARWKLSSATSWVALAHDLGLPCHVGRVGSYKRIAWARDAGADSCDTTMLLRETHKIPRALELASAGRPSERAQTEMPWARSETLVSPYVTGEWVAPVRRDDVPDAQLAMFDDDE